VSRAPPPFVTPLGGGSRGGVCGGLGVVKVMVVVVVVCVCRVCVWGGGGGGGLGDISWGGGGGGGARTAPRVGRRRGEALVILRCIRFHSFLVSQFWIL